MLNSTRFLLLSLCLLGWSCSGDKDKNIPDVSAISVDLDILRFEQDLFAIDTNNVAEGLTALEQKHPDFTNTYFTSILRIPKDRLSPEDYTQAIGKLVALAPFRHVYDTTQQIIGDLSTVESELQSAFQFYRHYFPEEPIPTIYTFVSEYAYGAFVAPPNILAIGLDFYLGEDYPYYNPQFFPRYIRRTMTKEHIPIRAMEALINDLAGNPKGDRLIDMMIHNGKKLYALDQLLPYTPDSLKLGYTAAQTEWCNNNEQQLWAHFLSEDLLYSTDYQKFRKLVDYSPHSPGMPEEAPGLTANWTGWQIVKSYMQRHPKTSLKALFALEDAQILMQKARYKPRR